MTADGRPDNARVIVEERVFLSKFDGEALPENEVERLEILDGNIIAQHVIKNGEIVSTTKPGEDS